MGISDCALLVFAPRTEADDTYRDSEGEDDFLTGKLVSAFVLLTLPYFATDGVEWGAKSLSFSVSPTAAPLVVATEEATDL